MTDTVYGMALLAVLSTVYGMELLAVLSVGKALLSVLGVGYTRSSEIVRIPGMVLVIGSATIRLRPIFVLKFCRKT